MPIYEFHCEQCEKDSEILVRSTEWQGTACPHCGSLKLSKKFSVFASANGGGGAPACESGGRKPRGCGACASGRPHQH